MARFEILDGNIAPLGEGSAGGGMLFKKIGRASCRERVCLGV